MKIIHGDSLIELNKLPENSVDSVVCDPPYLLNFMGKEFDREKGNPADDVEFWKLVLKTMKPGAHLLAAGIGRTHHRVMVAIEDAGFEIRDCVYHVFGSGFTKSHNIEKTLIKMGENEKAKEFAGFGTTLKPAVEIWTLARKPLSESTIALNVLKWGTGGINIEKCRVEGDMGKDRAEGKPRIDTDKYGKANSTLNPQSPLGRFPANIILDGSDEVVGLFPDTGKSAVRKGGSGGSGLYKGKFGDGAVGGFTDSGSASRYFQKCEMACEDVSFMIELEICGTILENQKAGIMLVGVIKEAEKLTQDVEQFIIGNKKTESFQKDIVSIIKITTKQMTDLKILLAFPLPNITKFTEESEKTTKWLEELNTEDVKNVENIKRLIVFKNELLELIRDTVRIVAVQNLKSGEKQTERNTMLTTENTGSRFKYQSKASKRDRNEGLEGFETSEKFTAGNYSQSPTCKTCDKTLNGTNDHSRCSGEVYYKEMESKNTKNNHPTVKNTSLMQYLVRLVTPKGGTCLDPFMGSGSTGKACKLEGFDFIGIELDADYCKIAEARINHAPSPLL